MHRFTLAWLLLLGWFAIGLQNSSYSLGVRTSSENSFGGSSAQDSTRHKKRVYTTIRISNPPKIDGKLDDDCWKLGEWQNDYIQYAPIYKAKATHPTDLKILYDDKNVFVAIRAYDNRSEITRRLGRRDNYDGDVVGVHFDSYHDLRTAFVFDITSAGQKIDVWVANDGWDTNWNAVWYAKVAYEDSAWTAEFQIPLCQLRYGKSNEQ
ncbi:carbohydrate binding family 9 domain-containing protein [Mangrovibacterium lignilyticum]|uniref:carbohydrate binding family 9 domain-containing protein n=1 Tax=Mangrovibacterium lignilyticum TaxID=2668052 RepID=UPI0013D1D6A2|nr:carbohydrate binding family 9 domain-containing protein [Mangrovibacterium lignilyticum]